MQIFPNPTNGQVTLLTYGNEVTTITLFGIRGEQVLQSEVTAQKTLSVSHLPKGMYIVRATSGSEVATQKLVVE